MPSPDSLKWAGQEHSILSSILLWGLWICRVFSLLQILKLLLRTILKLLKRSTTDENATRINVPPMFCELYFIAWFLVFVFGHLLGWSHPVFLGCAVYYLFETVAWVLYYTVFRRFYEENYSIYHELEYLTVLFLVIPTQALAFATLYRTSFRNMLSGLLGAGDDATPFPVRVLGALFAAIVISMIISAFPAERVKKKEKQTKMHVIGCGDVVQNRLYPALRHGGVSEKNLIVYDIENSDERLPYCNYYSNPMELSEELLDAVDDSSVVWIETPSYTHIPYLRMLLETKAELIVLEKPITTIADELDYVEEISLNDAARERIFFLSYYTLEKALPLCYLTHQNPNHLKYLEVEDKLLLQNWRPLLGTLKSLEIVINEGDDRREWVYDDVHGGQLMETFIHHILVASHFVGLPEYWSDTKLRTARDGNDITLSAKSGEALISLSLKKCVPEHEKLRFARLTFSGGSVYADIDEQTATVYFAELDKTCHISVKQSFRGKYSILADLVTRVERGECSASSVDGLSGQIRTIRWLLGQMRDVYSIKDMLDK